MVEVNTLTKLATKFLERATVFMFTSLDRAIFVFGLHDTSAGRMG